MSYVRIKLEIVKYQASTEQNAIHKRPPKNRLLILVALGFLLIGLTITNIPIVYSQSSSDTEEGGEESTDGGGDGSSDGGGDGSSDGGGDGSSDGGEDGSSDGGEDGSSDGGEETTGGGEETTGGGEETTGGGEETTGGGEAQPVEKEEICDNGMDDDDDNDIDKDDSDCKQQQEEDKKQEICGNGEDDDDDGDKDEKDLDCKVEQVGILQLNMSELPSEKKQEICGNGEDDDDDGDKDEKDLDCKVEQVGILNLSKLPSELSTLPQDERRATGTFIVQVINDNEGSKQPQDFQLSIEGKASPSSFDGAGPPGITVSFSGIGDFSLNTYYDDSYTESMDSGCPTGQIPGTFTCTITYDDIPPPPPPPPPPAPVQVCDEDKNGFVDLTFKNFFSGKCKETICDDDKDNDHDGRPDGQDSDCPVKTSTWTGPLTAKPVNSGRQLGSITEPPQIKNGGDTPEPGKGLVDTPEPGKGLGISQGVGPGTGPVQSIPQLSSNQMPPLTPQPFTTYKSDEKSLSVEYPNDWQITENANNVTFKSPPESSSDRFQEAFRVLKVPYKSSLSALTDNIVGDAKANLPSFQIINSTDTILGGIPANSLVYTYTDNRVGTLQEMVVLTIKDDSAYIIGFIAELPKYNYYLPVLQEMINSIELSDNKSETSSLLPFIPQQAPSAGQDVVSTLTNATDNTTQRAGNNQSKDNPVLDAFKNIFGGIMGNK